MNYLEMINILLNKNIVLKNYKRFLCTYVTYIKGYLLPLYFHLMSK